MWEDKTWKIVLQAVFLITSGLSSPVITPIDLGDNIDPFIPSNFCLLSPELGYTGEVKFIEDCQSLGRYQTIPLPGDFYRKLGTHPIVCCPQLLPNSSICFESDAWCLNYKQPKPVTFSQEEIAQLQQAQTNSNEEQIPIVTDPTVQVQEIPKMADKECRNNGQFTNLPGIGELSQCVPLNQCGKILDNAFAPQTQVQPCGFDESEEVMMICCPDDYVTEPESLEQKPRFPARNGRARQAEDKSDQCRKWRNNDGCSLDKDIVISEVDPNNGKVLSKVLYDFMQGACLKSCGWARRKGCVDEHPRCPEWARKGTCIINPFFMTHTCRESCGVCGFLSPNSKEEQVVGGLSYTDFTKQNFDCGRYKPLCEINNEDCEEKTTSKPEITTLKTTKTNTDPIDADIFDLRELDDSDDVFFSIDPSKSPEDYFCGATMVSDRWVVAAAHCYDEFEVSADNKPKQVKINTIRDNTEHIEIVEIKKVYKHPQYKYPTLYDDIAVLELGRRVEYNYDLYGDTPSCIDQGQDNIDKIATVQGYGLTETGERGELLETNVTVITNELCKEYLDHNATNNKLVRQKIDKALPFGLKYGLICAQGKMNDEGIFRGSCKGDSGGPLTALNEDDRTTLIGIVSGGIGCGRGYPGWYTNVSFHTKWIKCIINNSVLYGNVFEKVRKACENVATPTPKCATNDDLIFGDLRNVDSDVDICLNGATVVDGDDDYDDDIFGDDQ
eukprot:GFUD01020782.1.p1 GENE.GFUD01020782.1~~GFUD01020782.1.p1  ORF type:complete len:726 (+),score=150.54 GFUD01020782.1:33-2210(+)